jgi:hypothetical protein
MKANILDQMYYGQSPANFGQISHYDAARGECYRDFGDCIGISSRTLIQGLFGIIPQSLYGQCIIRPGFPSAWQHASVKTPYLDYQYQREGTKVRVVVTQRFPRPLQIILRQNTGSGTFHDVEGSKAACQVIEYDLRDQDLLSRSVECGVRSENTPAAESASEQISLHTPHSSLLETHSSLLETHSRLGLSEPILSEPFRTVSLDRYFNAEVGDIFKNKYQSPRPQTTTLQIPLQGIGEWCHPHQTAEISDSVFRRQVSDGVFRVAGVPMATPAEGRNIIYTSLWDVYPDSVVLPLKGSAARAYLLMAGSTNHMQSRIDNALVVAAYTDGSTDTLALRNPDNWCPIEQDYYVDGLAFRAVSPRPYRVSFSTGIVSRHLCSVMPLGGDYGREIPGGAGQMLVMPLNARKRLRSLTLRTLSNDVVVGLMAVTLQ